MGDVIPLQAEHFDHAARHMSNAFQRDPSWIYQFPDEARRPQDVEWLFRRWIPCMQTLGQCYTTSDGMGTALWTPPGASADFPLPLLLRSGLLFGPFRLGPGWLMRTMRVWRDSLAREHDEIGDAPHWVLVALGVDPVAQGKGHGVRLLHHVLQKSDSEGVPSYVQTHNPANIAYYERHGFRLILRRAVCPGGPECCSMRRVVGG